jgi:hypothetical protein
VNSLLDYSSTCSSVPDLREDRSLSDTVAAQAIRDEASRLVFQPMQQTLEETLRG